MIISEKQIMQLITVAADYRSTLSAIMELNDSAFATHDNIGRILNKITSQQSEELKVVE